MKAVNNRCEHGALLHHQILWHIYWLVWVICGLQFCVPQTHIYILKPEPKPFSKILWSSKDHRLIYYHFLVKF